MLSMRQQGCPHFIFSKDSDFTPMIPDWSSNKAVPGSSYYFMKLYTLATICRTELAPPKPDVSVLFLMPGIRIPSQPMPTKGKPSRRAPFNLFWTEHRAEPTATLTGELLPWADYLAKEEEVMLVLLLE